MPLAFNRHDLDFAPALLIAVCTVIGCISPPPSQPVESSDGRGNASVGDAATLVGEPEEDLAWDGEMLADAFDTGEDLKTSQDVSPDIAPRGDAGDPGVAMLIVGNADALSLPEQDLSTFLEAEGFTVTAVSDDDAAEAVNADVTVVIMTRTASSGTVGGALRQVTAPIVHWEYAQQWSDYLGTVTEPSTAAAVAQSAGRSIYVDPAAPDALRCGIEGELNLYPADGWEVTFAQPQSLGDDAVRVATLGADDPRVAYYAYERGSTLADGSTAVGPRVYFGVDRDSWSVLTDEALDLFRCGLGWAKSRRVDRR